MSYDDPYDEDMLDDEDDLDTTISIKRRAGAIIAAMMIAGALLIGSFGAAFQSHSEQNALDALPAARAEDIGSWSVKGGSAKQQDLFLRVLQSGDSSTYPLLRDLAPQVHVIFYTDAKADICQSKNYSGCLITYSTYGDEYDQFDLYLRIKVINEAPPGFVRHLIWHEMGHAVQASGIKDPVLDEWWDDALERNDGEFDLAQSDDKSDQGPVPRVEVWADHFAMYATGSDSYEYNYDDEEDTMSRKEVKAVLDQYDPSTLPSDVSWN